MIASSSTANETPTDSPYPTIDKAPRAIFKIGSLDEPAPINQQPTSRPPLQSQPSCARSEAGDLAEPTALFPSMRLVLAALLCCCYMALAISTSNISVGIICMSSCPLHPGLGGTLDWRPSQEGYVLAAQNAGNLLMLLTGMWADRLNGKWMVMASLVLCVSANAILPMVSPVSLWLTVLCRMAVGAADACLIPAATSLITRWFPQAERSAAIGIISGGRQLGSLFILPAAGWLCTQRIAGGWPAIFYLSALVSLMVVFFWLPFGADKPSKQCCISEKERLFVESRIACESIGKRTDRGRRVPYRAMLRSSPLWAAAFAMVCHEYPLVIMLQFLPNYLRDVLEFQPTENGLISALPMLCLFLSKTLSSSLSSWLIVRKEYDKTRVCKVFNGIASAGLSICIGIVPFFDKDHATLAVICLCGAMFSAGMHTPGVQTALVQLAPPFSGIITGWTFFAVAWFGIGNKILTKKIVQQGSATEWAIVFHVASLVAALPVIFFSIWGSADRQIWASPSSKLSVASMYMPNRIASLNTQMTREGSQSSWSLPKRPTPPPIRKISTLAPFDSNTSIQKSER
ncbi:unnamed protein product, partial [Mesorhabditis belari]|uniref:Major facilitator superfamily (MFS) profile domain-containing protein n=1 Tax=Mesorhabditis belari TaxID=2138241 RepID=A0AAF3J6K1_9BILA